LMPSVAKQLMSVAPICAEQLEPIVERIARTVFDSYSDRLDSQRKSRRDTIPTPLTGANRSRGRDALRKTNQDLGAVPVLIAD